MTFIKAIYKRKQKESASGLLLAAALFAACTAPAMAQTGLDAGGLTFRDFSVADNGASFSRQDLAAPEAKSARLLGIDTAAGKAQVSFGTIKVEAAIPTGWYTGEDSERGLAYSGDRSYRLLLWHVDFAFEGVKDAEHYATEKAGAIQARRQGVRARTRPLGDGSYLITYENVAAGAGDHESRTVYDIIMPMPGDPKTGVLMTLGVPTSQADRGFKLLALLRQNLRLSR